MCGIGKPATMCQLIVTVCGVCLLSLPVCAQTGPLRSIEQLPAIERSASDFYSAISIPGRTVTAEWQVPPGQQSVDEELNLTLRIGNVANPTELEWPDLQELPEIREAFQILGSTEPEIDGQSASISYRLRPRQAGTFEIPNLKYRYVRPELPPGRRIVTTYAKAVTLTISATEAKEREVKQLVAPARFLELAKDSRTGVNWPLFSWLVLPGIAVALSLIRVTLWRRQHPTGWRRHARRLSQAKRQALRQLSRLPANEKTAAEITAIVADFFQQVSKSTRPATSTEEILLDARLSGLPTSQLQSLQEILYLCDKSRYSSSPLEAGLLRDRATTWFRSLEPARHLSSTGFWVMLGCMSIGSLAAAPASLNEVSDAETAFARGVELTDDSLLAQPEFHRAARIFDREWESGRRSPALAQNRCRAWFLAGDNAMALLAALEGLQQYPWHPGVKEDYETYLAELPAVSASDRFRQAVWLSPFDWIVLAVPVSFGLNFGLAGFFTVRSRTSIALLGVSLLSLSVMAVICTVQQEEIHQSRQRSLAVVRAETVLRSGNSQLYEPASSEPLPAFSEVDRLSFRGGWRKVALPNGRTGWLPSHSLAYGDSDSPRQSTIMKVK